MHSHTQTGYNVNKCRHYVQIVYTLLINEYILLDLF